MFLEERRHKIVPNKFAEGESETATTCSAKKGVLRDSPRTGLTLLTFTQTSTRMILIYWISGMFCIDFPSKRIDPNSHENYILQAHQLIGMFTKLYDALSVIVGGGECEGFHDRSD
jgi:hypothetical protein